MALFTIVLRQLAENFEQHFSKDVEPLSFGILDFHSRISLVASKSIIVFRRPNSKEANETKSFAKNNRTNLAFFYRDTLIGSAELSIQFK